jgi:hypothetical protein
MPSRGCLSTPPIVKTRGVFRTISPGTMPPHGQLNSWKPWWEARQSKSTQIRDLKPFSRRFEESVSCLVEQDSTTSNLFQSALACLPGSPVVESRASCAGGATGRARAPRRVTRAPVYRNLTGRPISDRPRALIRKTASGEAGGQSLLDLNSTERALRQDWGLAQTSG